MIPEPTAEPATPPDRIPATFRRLFRSTLASRVLCFIIANLAIALVVRLLVLPAPIQFNWWTQMCFAAGMLLAGTFVCMNLWLHWVRPARHAAVLLAQVRAGEAPIEELGKVGGGVAPLLAEAQEVFRDLRRQKAEIAQFERDVAQRIANRTDALERSLGAIRAQAARDALTGLYNRRMLDSLLPDLLDRCRAEGSPLSLMMIDVDDFKLLNDTLGHAAGDEFLRDLGQLIRSTIGDADLAFRYGGDEFIILLPTSTHPQVTTMSHRLISLVDSLAKPLAVARPPRLSIGLLCSTDFPFTLPGAMLIQAADRKLYEIKSQRKGRRSTDHMPITNFAAA